MIQAETTFQDNMGPDFSFDFAKHKQIWPCCAKGGFA
jgi:hypothetical protein